MQNDMAMIEEQADQTIIGDDLTSFLLQVGFVESINPDAKKFNTLQEAYQHIFQRNKEFAIFLWNGIPVRLSYLEDIPYMIYGILLLLNDLIGKNPKRSTFIEFSTPNLETSWSINVNEPNIEISSNWKRVEGNYEMALNQVSMLIMSKEDFVAEWKLLLLQLIQSFRDAGARFNNKNDLLIFGNMVTLVGKMPKRGRLYQNGEQ